MKMFQNLVLLLTVLAVSGCAARLPEPIRGDGSELASYTTVVEAGDAAVGTSVRWGGVIVQVHNREDHSEIEVVYFDLRGTGRPLITNTTPGRFRFIVSGFAEPEVFRVGREVTVLGDVVGFHDDLIGEYVFQFPMLEPRGFQFWREDLQRIEVWYRDPFSPWYRHYLYGTGPYRYHPYYFPYGTRVIRTVPATSTPRRSQKQPEQGGSELIRPQRENRIQ